MRTAVVGHVEWLEFAHVDRIPGPGEIAHATRGWQEPAGGGAVAAVQLHRLAGDCTFFTALGEDELGERVLTALERLGLRVEAVRRNEPTRRAIALIDPAGERTITTLGARLHVTGDDKLPWDELASTDAVYFCAGDPAALRQARGARVLVATSRVSPVLSVAGVRLDAVVGSGRDPDERGEPLSPAPALVVRTEGPDGGTYETADGRAGRYEAFPPPGPVVDTYGSGDSFAAGLAYGLAAADVPSALRLAARCGAWCVAGRGPYGNQLTARDLEGEIAPPGR